MKQRIYVTKPSENIDINYADIQTVIDTFTKIRDANPGWDIRIENLIEHDYWDDGGHVSCTANFSRLENDEEFAARVAAEKVEAAKARAEKRASKKTKTEQDYARYLELKKQFEK